MGACVTFLSFFLFFPGINQGQDIDSLLNQISADTLQKHITNLCNADGHFSRVTFTEGNYWAADYIARYFEKLPGITSVSRDSFFVPSYDVPYNDYPIINVVALIQGQSSEEETIMIGAHYDASASREDNWQSAWSSLDAVGADDNATGVAAMMEVARILGTNPAFLPEKTVRFVALGAEEYHPTQPNIHHVGSLLDADRLADNQYPLTAVLILDMIGYNPNTDYIEVISDPPSRSLAAIVQDLMQTHVPDLKTNTYPVDVPYSDHESYQQYGFPAILLMENDRPWNNDWPNYSSNPHYHSTSDSIGTLNFSQIHKVTQTALASTIHLSQKSPNTLAHKSVYMNENLPLSELMVAPNPFNNQAYIRFRLNKPLQMSIAIYATNGEKIMELCRNRPFAVNSYALPINGDRLASGVYFCHLISQSFQRTIKLVILK